MKAALKPAYGEKKIDKDQYTAINCQVSRTIYREVGHTQELAQEKDKWKSLAATRVNEAIKTLKGDGSHGCGKA